MLVDPFTFSEHCEYLFPSCQLVTSTQTGLARDIGEQWQVLGKCCTCFCSHVTGQCKVILSSDWSRDGILNSDWLRVLILNSDWLRDGILTADWLQVVCQSNFGSAMLPCPVEQNKSICDRDGRCEKGRTSVEYLEKYDYLRKFDEYM